MPLLVRWMSDCMLNSVSLQQTDITTSHSSL